MTAGHSNDVLPQHDFRIQTQPTPDVPAIVGSMRGRGFCGPCICRYMVSCTCKTRI